MLQEMLTTLLTHMASLVDTALALAISAAVLALARYVLLTRKGKLLDDPSLWRMSLMLVLTGVAAVVVILTLPIGDSARGQLLGLLGLLLSATFALSSTSFMGNAMAGFMLRALRNFRPGDFIHVGEQFGRVTHRGLLHTELQTEERDLTTLPNLYLVTQPVKVVHYDGTIISATVSLGYDVPRGEVESALLRAAERAELSEPFVHVVELGDFSVVYRVHGFLPRVTLLITARSRLREQMLDCLHERNIEIVSPTFMNQRVITGDPDVLPRVSHRRVSRSAEAEALMFDKADQAAARMRLKARLRDVRQRIQSFEAEVDETQDAETSARLGTVLDKLRERASALEAQLKDGT